MPNEQEMTNDDFYEQVFGITTDQIEEIRHKALEQAKTTRHRWRQKGFWLVCTSCQYPHSVWIKGKVMVGEKEDGTPILE